MVFICIKVVRYKQGGVNTWIDYTTLELLIACRSKKYWYHWRPMFCKVGLILLHNIINQCIHNLESLCSYGLCIWHFNLYLHVSVCAQPMIKVKPCGVGFIPLSSNPQVKVANSCIQLLCDGLLLHYKPFQQSNISFFCKRTFITHWSLETPFTWVSAHLRTILRAQ